MAELSNTKKLSNDQYDKARELARERVRNNNPEPRKSDFEEEHDRVWRVEDLPIMILFVALFFLSGVHVFQTIGEIAVSVYASTPVHAGIYLRNSAFIIAHQVGFTMLAEFSMLGFMILMGLKPAYTNSHGQYIDPLGYKRKIFIVLVIASMAFTVWANVESGLPVPIAVLIPAITIGVGFYIEQKIVDVTLRRRRVLREFRKAASLFKEVQVNPESDPEWKKIFYNEVYQRLMSLKANKEWANSFEGDVPPELKAAIVTREINGRENWIDVQPALIATKNVTQKSNTLEGVKKFILDNNLWDAKTSKLTVTYDEIIEAMGGGSKSTISKAKNELAALGDVS